jgi:serine/threonine-protein kinase
VEEALRPARAAWDAHKSFHGGTMAAGLDVLEGRFDVARTALEDLQERFAAHKDEWRWLLLTRTLFDLYEETGEKAAAVRLAQSLTARLPVLPTNAGGEDWAMAQDPTPLLYEVQYANGAFTRAERDAKRDAWIGAWRTRTTPAFFGSLWVDGYASFVRSPEDALLAVQARAAFGPLPAFPAKTASNAAIGRTFALAGDGSTAIPYLRKATHACTPLDFPFAFVQSNHWLGVALAEQGDRPGACEALRAVITRWGDARPRSVTATAARAKARELHCPAE